MRSNEPLFLILDRHLVLNVLQVVIRGQIKVVRSRDVVIEKLRVIFNKTKSLIRVINFASLNINKVLLDVLGSLLHRLLFFQLFIKFFFVSHNARLSLAELFE